MAKGVFVTGTGTDVGKTVDQDIEIMNPETVIATLNGGADSKLYMEQIGRAHLQHPPYFRSFGH